MANSHSSLSIDEIISTINRSRWPNVIVEGRDDVIVYRKLERIYFNSKLSILPAGGRDAVLRVFERSNEINPNKKFAFIVDRDLWVINGVPEKFKSPLVFFSDGYSIENDVFCDGRVDEMLSPTEFSKFEDELSRFVKWYALALSRVLAGHAECIKTHPNEILDDSDTYNILIGTKIGEYYPDDLATDICINYRKKLRGKSLMALAMRHLSYKGRSVRHNHMNILETIATNRGPLLNKLFAEVAFIL